MKISDQVLRIPTEKEVKALHLESTTVPAIFSENIKEYTSPNQAEEAIEDIQNRWSKVSKETRWYFETYGVIFALPEDEFGI